MELLRSLRDDVPAQDDLSGVERRLAELRATGWTGGRGLARGLGRRPGRAPARLRWGLALAGAGVLAAATVTAVRLPDASREPAQAHPSSAQPRTSSARIVLEDAALVAHRSKAVTLRPDQWIYVKESQHLGGDLPAFERWSRLDGTRMALREDGGELKIGDAEKGPTHPGRTQAEVEALPADPDALIAHFRGLGRELTPLSLCEPNCPPEIAGDVKVWGAIGWYMKFGPMIPPATTAAMYRALAKLPHVTVEEDATDSDGRPGIGVVFDAGAAGKAYYILDKSDYHYMGVKIVYSGRTVGMSVLASGIVDEPGRLP
ncbi:CU044_5270 family protein [Nonomuraea pusilla]|uniref:CU044_5270 family protein n=1 Tax=Nonomuraea pusilla TaxID=46177 RepID=UPI0033235D76